MRPGPRLSLGVEPGRVAPLGPVRRRDVLRQVVLGQRGRLGAAAALFSLHQAGEALVPVVIGVIVDRCFGPAHAGGAAELLRWLAVLGLVFATLSISYRFGSRLAEAAAERAAHRLRLQLTARVLHPRGGAENGRLPGALATIATSDAQRAGAINSALATGIAAITAMLVAAIALLRLSLPLGLLVLIGSPVLLTLAHRLGRPIEARSEAEQEQAAQASGLATDLVAGLRVLKGIGAEDTAAARYRRTSADSLRATLRAAGVQARYEGAMQALSGVFLALIALAGGRLAVRGEISVGELVAAVGLAQFLLGPLLVFAWAGSELAQGRASSGRIAAVLAEPAAVGPGTRARLEPVTGRIRLRQVTYGGLRELDVEVPAGRVVGVVTLEPGHAGALLRCLGREADPDRGTVELDGVALRELDPADVRSAIVVAAHDADLFGGPLIDNLIGSPTDGPTDGPDAMDRPGRRINDALAASQADQVMLILPGGRSGRLAERGSNLSGGQRQRVALARALATQAPVLVLHDPTTAVDTVTEARMATGIASVRAGRTTILVTTSPALLAVTERVFLLAGGTLAAEGTHQHLLRDDERYRTAVLR